MKLSNVALTEKGFIEKSITVQNLKNGNYELSMLATPLGSKKEQEIKMEFTQNGLNALLGTLMVFADK